MWVFWIGTMTLRPKLRAGSDAGAGQHVERGVHEHKAIEQQAQHTWVPHPLLRPPAGAAVT